MSTDKLKSYVEEISPYLTQWYVIALGGILVWYIGTSIKAYQFKQKYGCKEPPLVPGGFLSIKLLLDLLKTKSEGTMLEYAEHFFSLVKSQTFKLKLATVPIIFTQDPENIKAVLATQFNDFALGTRHAHFKPLLGDGIFTLDGDGWKNSRLLLRPQFAREQVAHVQTLEPHLQTLAEHISNKKGETFDIQELFFRLTVDAATEFLFGESVYSLRDGTVKDVAPLDFDGKSSFADSFNLSQSYLASRAYSQMFYFLINNKEFRNSNTKVHKFCKHYVEQALATSQDELDKKSKDGYIFLYELVKQTRNPKILQDQLLNILLAGRDTTAGLLSFTFFELARNPDVFEKLKNEIYTHFGDGANPRIETITFESLKRCEYLKFVFNEVLRLYPSVPINFRVSTKDTTIPRGGGPDKQDPVYVAKGTTVAYSVYTTHRLEQYYGKDSREFRPERWAENKKVGWAYVPFNGGPRICLGQQFALTEASYVVVRLIQMFPNLVSRDDRPYPPRKNVQLTMCHQDGVFISLNK